MSATVIVSLWDMLEKYAELIGSAIRSIQMAESIWRMAQRDERENPGLIRNPFSTVSDAITGNETPPTFEMDMRLQIAKAALDATRRACDALEMTDLLPEILRLEGSLRYPMTANVVRDFRHLAMSLKDKLDTQYFLHVEPLDVGFYNQASPFGEAVGKKFARATEDIEEAGKCLAVQQYTACVFHLMRVMEIGVKTLGKKLKVPINVEIENWYQIMDHVDGAIKKLPAKTAKEKRRKAQLGGASANLNGVRIAQRNEVMHPKETYTRDQARDVYNATRLFMDHLAGLV